MNKDLEKYLYSFLRNYFMKDIISYSKFCIIEEDKNKIMVKMTNKALKKNKKEYGLYTYHLLCIKNESASDILRKYNLNKPVYYVFDGFTFNESIDIISNCNLIFKNCTFNYNLYISNAKTVLLENNKYNMECSIDNDLTKCYLGLSVFCNDLTIRNDINFFCKININCKKVNIINSKILSKGLTDLFFKADELSLIQSEINSSSTVFIDTCELFSSNGIIRSKEGIIIEDKAAYNYNNYSLNCIFNAPIVIYNNVYLTDEKRYTTINQDKIRLNDSRQKLIKVLKQIRDNCVYINEKKKEEIELKLNDTPIRKVLK